MNRSIFSTLVLGLSALFARTAGAATLDGAELYSKETVKYGRWEMRMKVAATPGSVSTFFTYHNDSYKGAPEPWREIDIEVLGKNGNGFQSNLITGFAANRTMSEVFHTTTEDLTAGFHTYVLDWTPDSIVYRLDGKTLRTILGTNAQVKDLADRAQSYRMNLWASSSAGWVGALDESKLPIVQTVNWMTYSAYTPGQGPGGSNFTQKWTDDFTNLDAGRWALANWTFDGNLADFVPGNARVSGGYLMLVLSKKGWNGNISPPSDPTGGTRTVSVSPRNAAARFHADARDGLLRVDAGAGASGVVVSTLDGRILDRRTGSGIQEFKGLPRGSVVLVRTAAGARLVPVP